jgi:protein TonB
MSKELIIGIIVSVALHVGFLWGGEWFKDGPEQTVAKVEEQVVELMEMPPIEPDEPEVVEMTDEAPLE